MTDTQTLEVSRTDELTAQVATLKERRSQLNGELNEASHALFQVSEQAKIGLVSVAGVEAPRAAKTNLTQLLAELENEIALAQTALDAEIAAQADARFWAELGCLAQEAKSEGVAFDAIRNRVSNEILQGLAEMDAVSARWERVRQQFRTLAMSRISQLPALPGKVGRYQSDIDHSKQLLETLQSRGVNDIRNLRDALPCESLFGLVPTRYPYGDSEASPFSDGVQRMFDEGTFRKYVK